MTVFQVDVSQDTGLYDMEGKIFEKVTTSLNKKAIPCKNYVSDETDFNSCCKKVFTEFIANNSNCTTYFSKKFLKFEVRINFTQTQKGFLANKGPV